MGQNKTGNVTALQILQTLNELAPQELAASWDKIGLQAGNPDQIVSRVVLTLDVRAETVKFAAESDSQLIICHHPLIFSPLDAVRSDIPEQALLIDLISSQISVIAAHTNLDAASGGVADSLADALGLDDTGRQIIDLFGRCNDLREPEKLSHLMARTSQRLGSCGCRINTDQDSMVRRLAVFPGSFDESCIPGLVDMGVDVMICGEIKHHHGLMLAARGIAAIDVGHDVSERVVLEPLAAKLKEKLPQISFAVCSGLDYNKMVF